MSERVVVPVLVTVYWYWIWSPAAAKLEVVDDVVIVMLELAELASTVTTDGDELTMVPDGVVPAAVAELVTDPLSTSAWVTV